MLVTGTTMDKEKASKKSSHPPLVMLNRALKLAEKWVNDMSGSLEDNKSTEPGLDSRPARLGVGATVPRQSKIIISNDPLERKLHAKLDAGKRFVKSAEDSASLDEDSDEELESKTQAFSKKRPPSFSSPLLTKKKKT